jgi:purine-binding chemotaxis protein CheW
MTAETQHALVPASGGDSNYDLLVVLRLAGQEYGLMASGVREIIRYRGTTRVPNAPAGVTGVINLRGRIVPLFSLYSRLGLVAAAADSEQAVMVVEFHGEDAGLLVDSVSDVLKIDETTIDRRASLVESTGGRHFIEGTVNVSGRLVTLLRLEALIGDDA